MTASLWPTLGWYCLFSFFVFQHQLHAKSFRGESQSFGLILSIFGFGGMLAGLAYLGAIAYWIAWWAPILALIVGTLVAGIASGLLARSQMALLGSSLAGFIGAPASAYLMFSSAAG